MSSFAHFSESDIDNALAKTKERTGIILERALLRALANDTGAAWYRDGRRKGLLPNAKRLVLLKSPLTQRSEQEERRYNAYSSAISILFSERAHRAKLARANRTAQSTNDCPYGFNERGQGEFLFGRRDAAPA